jgi:cytochrome c peroxidase
MPLIFQASPLTMQWCLDCHRNPQVNLRPKEEIFNMNWAAPANQEEVGKKLAADYKLRSTSELTSCSTCHR